jgi:hypothetical protein
VDDVATALVLRRAAWHASVLILELVSLEMMMSGLVVLVFKIGSAAGLIVLGNLG